MGEKQNFSRQSMKKYQKLKRQYRTMSCDDPEVTRGLLYATRGERLSDLEECGEERTDRLKANDPRARCQKSHSLRLYRNSIDRKMCGDNGVAHLLRVPVRKRANAVTASSSALALWQRQHQASLGSCDKAELRGGSSLRHTFSDAAMAALFNATTAPPKEHETAAKLSNKSNQFVDVSSDFMRISGFGRRYKWLLSNSSNANEEGPSSGRQSGSLEGPGAAMETAPDDREADDVSIIQHADAKVQNEKMRNGITGSTAMDYQTFDVEQTGKSSAKFDQQPPGKRVHSGKRAAPAEATKNLYYLRKILWQRRTRACDWSVLFAVAGVILTVIDAELTATGTVAKNGYVSNSLRAACVITTLVLLIWIVKYHLIVAKITHISTGADDWRVTFDFRRMVQCVIELCICTICPIPGYFSITCSVLDSDHRQTRNVDMPLDAILSVPMLLRSYLICRFIALHNGRYQDTATRSVAALNYVNVNFPFVLKTMMHERPLRVLLTFAVVFWICMSWLITQCERYSGVKDDSPYLNAVWMVIVTFTSIGYGDVVPSTYCGRALAITTGIMGAGVSSALIAVVSSRLDLTRAEKHVNQFIHDSKLAKQKKNTAAAVLQHTWFIHRYKHARSLNDEHKLLVHQRKFVAAITEFRRIKWNQRKLVEQGYALLDVAKLQNDMNRALCDMRQGQDELAMQLGSLHIEIDRLIVMHKSRNATRENVELKVPGLNNSD